MSNTNNVLEYGKMYYRQISKNERTETPTLAPIKPITRDVAIFYCTEFPVTPFVIWNYKFVTPDSLAVCSGHYFSTIDKALDYMYITYNYSKHLILSIEIICSECNHTHTDSLVITDETTLVDIKNFIEYNLHCENDDHIAYINKVSFEKDYNKYDIPFD